MAPETSITEGLMPPSEALARELVLPPGEIDSSATSVLERLAFRVGPFGMLCAMELGREVVPQPESTHLPHLPAWLAGVANVRGMLVPVVDPANVFELEAGAPSRRYLLIFGAGEDIVGLLVDSLPAPCLIEPADQRLSGMPPHPAALKDYVLGSYEHEGEVWLDVDMRGFMDMLAERLAR